MSRVWKHFLKKLMITFGVFLYMLVAAVVPLFIADYLDYEPVAGMAIGIGLFIIFPIVCFLIRHEYLDSKREIELENQQIMRSLKKDQT